MSTDSISIALIGCTQMRSAFLKGVELLSVPESNPVQTQGRTVEKSSKYSSEQMEGISGVPKNVTQLQPVISKLMCKVIMIAI
jgi:hypothetical protein